MPFRPVVTFWLKARRMGCGSAKDVDRARHLLDRQQEDARQPGAHATTRGG